MERKLTAILSADVQGYSRLMGEDEEATLRTLTSHRKLMDSQIAQHRGRIVGTAGDSVLAEFVSVIDAVRCAVEIQQQLHTRNADLPVQRRMEFRIGINLGDVMVDGEQIYGDGVNIAARLQALADAGGICISGSVYEQIKTKLGLRYEDRGAQVVKNIAEPVRVWRIGLEEAGRPAFTGEGQKERRGSFAGRHWVVAAAVGLVLITGTVLALRYLSLPPISPQASAPRTDVAPASLPLPDKPSLIVLPFVNLSQDPAQEYFSDGLTETLTGALSKISSLFVIARNSAFTYKGKAVKVQDVGREMGVRYVLEGSVLKAGEQVRITAQLIEASSGYHLWSEQYDRPLKDVLRLHDEIAQKIVTTLRLQLTLQEQGYLVRKHTDNLEAYDAFLRGMEYRGRSTKEDNTRARQIFEKAVALDPQYAEAHAWLGWIYLQEWLFGWSTDPQTLEHALALAQQAVALDDSLPVAHSFLGRIYALQQQYEQAIAEGERAMTLDPNEAFSNGYAILAEGLSRVGRAEDAVAMAEQALHRKPITVDEHLSWVGTAYYLTGRPEEAIAPLKQYLSRYPNILGAHLTLAAVYSEFGNEAEARTEAAEVLRLNPQFSLEVHKQRAPIKDPTVLERHLTALRRAGLK